MGSHSYITDCSNEEERTKFIGHLMGCNFIGLCLGAALVSVFMFLSSFVRVLLLVAIANIVLIFLIILFIKESVYGYIIQQDGKPKETESLADENKENLKLCNSWRALLGFFSKTRPDNIHVYLRILFAAILFNQVTKAGEQDSILLYVMQKNIGWTDVIYGAYISSYYASMAFNLIILFPLLEKSLQPSDSTLILVGLMMKTLRLVGTALTTNTYAIFAFAVLGSPAGYIIAALRSLVTKLANEDEVGTCFALMSFVETFANLFGAVLFTSIYAATMRFFPGTVFLIDAGLHVCMFLVIIWIKIRIHKINANT